MTSAFIKSFRQGVLFFLLPFLSACTSSAMIQPQINSLVVAEKFDYALDVLDNNEASYGPKNRLLYLLDYGLILHLAGRYQESIRSFEEAKKIFDQYFTVSLSKEATTWLVNDNTAPYRGEDFERVMINVFQAMNFALLDNFEEALVEARDVDGKLALINRQYEDDQKNVYQEDAFARLLMGILYEANRTMADINDAFISYAKAVAIYENDFFFNYDVRTPEILKENILTAASFMGKEEFAYYREKFKDTAFLSLEDKGKKGEVYLLHYYGLSPIKHQVAIPIPLPGGFVTKLAFPTYDPRSETLGANAFKAVDINQNIFESSTERVEDIGAIAMENLSNRKARVIAKAVLRSAGKYFFEKKQEENIRERYGDETAHWFRYVSNLYNITSEQADLRSWQTLPAEIHMARLMLPPGEYELFLNDDRLGTLSIASGQKKFFAVRTTR